jgi:ATP-dependent RNA helicase DHX57
VAEVRCNTPGTLYWDSFEAQTSITIDDIVYIIDSGRVKEVQYDPGTQLSSLVESWVSKAAGRQRRGRAGRTQPGVCYKTYTRKQERDMPNFSVPEILRVSLNNVCLSVKATRENEDVQVCVVLSVRRSY